MNPALCLASNSVESGRREIQITELASGALVSDGDSNRLAVAGDGGLLAADGVAVRHSTEAVELLDVQGSNKVAGTVSLAAGAQTRVVVGSVTRVAVARSRALLSGSRSRSSFRSSGNSRGSGSGGSGRGSRSRSGGGGGNSDRGNCSGRNNRSSFSSGSLVLVVVVDRGIAGRVVSVRVLESVGLSRSDRSWGTDDLVGAHQAGDGGHGDTVLVNIDVDVLVNVLSDVNNLSDDGSRDTTCGQKGDNSGESELHF